MGPIQPQRSEVALSRDRESQFILTDSSSACSDPATFTFIETATSGVKSRNHIVPLASFKPSTLAVDVFRSTVRFTADVQSYVTDPERSQKYAANVAEGRPRPSIAGYDGSALADGLHLDLDGPLDRVQQELAIILEWLRERWDIPTEAVWLSFSGNKGFHLFIPANLFGNFAAAPCRQLERQIKRAVELLLDGLSLTTVDWGVYGGVQLWRVENTKHHAGRFCIPVTAAEALGDLDTLFELAAAPQQVVRVEPDDWAARDELADLWQRAEETVTAPQHGDGLGWRKADDDERLSAGHRHPRLVAEAAPLGLHGYSADAIFALLLVVDRERCDPPIAVERGEGEIRAIAEWAAHLADLHTGPDPEPPADPDVPDLSVTVTDRSWAPEGSWCAACRTQGTALELDREDAQMRAQTAEAQVAALRDQLRLLRRLRRNAGLNGERHTAAALADYWEQRERAGRILGATTLPDGHRLDAGWTRAIIVGRDGSHPSEGTVAYEAGAGDKKVVTDLERFAQAGVIDLHRCDYRARILGQRRKLTEYFVRLPDGSDGLRAAAAVLDLHIPRGAAAHHRCPHCGSEKVRRVRAYQCEDCHGFFLEGDEPAQGELGDLRVRVTARSGEGEARTEDLECKIAPITTYASWREVETQVPSELAVRVTASSEATDDACYRCGGELFAFDDAGRPVCEAHAAATLPSAPAADLAVTVTRRSIWPDAPAPEVGTAEHAEFWRTVALWQPLGDGGET